MEILIRAISCHFVDRVLFFSLALAYSVNSHDHLNRSPSPSVQGLPRMW